MRRIAGAVLAASLLAAGAIPAAAAEAWVTGRVRSLSADYGV